MRSEASTFAKSSWRACSMAGFSSGLRPTLSPTSSESSQIEIGSSVTLFSETSSFLSEVSRPMMLGSAVIALALRSSVES